MTLLRSSYAEGENGEWFPVFCFVLVLEEEGIEIVLRIRRNAVRGLKLYRFLTYRELRKSPAFSFFLFELYPIQFVSHREQRAPQALTSLTLFDRISLTWTY